MRGAFAILVLCLAWVFPVFAQEKANPADETDQTGQEKAVLDFWSKLEPGRVEEFEQSPQAEEKAERLRHMTAQMKELQMLEKENPERYQVLLAGMSMETQARIAAKAYREATTDEERNKAYAACEEAVGKLLDHRMQEVQTEMKDLEDRLSQRKKKLDAWQKNKAMVIENRVLQLTGSGEGILNF